MVAIGNVWRAEAICPKCGEHISAHTSNPVFVYFLRCPACEEHINLTIYKPVPKSGK